MNAPVALILICLIVIALGCAAWAAEQALDSDTMQDLSAWRPMPEWLPNPSASAVATHTTEGTRFGVPEPGRGMKWVRSVKGASLSDTPWLVVRYRASGIRAVNDYFAWLDAGGGPGVNTLLLDQLAVDGQWHTIATDVSALVTADTFNAMAVQVQAEAG